MAAFIKSYPNPYFQNILSNSAFIPIFNHYNTLINNHTLNDATNLTEIDRFEKSLSTIIFNIIDLNSSNIKALTKLGSGVYGTTFNKGNGTIIKSQNTSHLFSIFKESLIQQKLSCDPLYGHTIPYVFSLKKYAKNKYRINMEKVDTSIYKRFDVFLHELSLNTRLNNQQKIIILFKKIIGLSVVLNHFQDTYGFVHNDLKPDNFFVSNDISNLDLTVIDTNIKIIDFGLSGIQEGTNYIISQPVMLENCDLAFYSKLNTTSYSKTSDFIYLLTFMIKSYTLNLQTIFGPYYNDFESLFDAHIDYKGTIYTISLINILDEIAKINQFFSFFTSKNSESTKEVIKKIYKTKYSILTLKSKDIKIVQKLILNFYEKFLPINIEPILNWYITQYLPPIAPSTSLSISTPSASRQSASRPSASRPSVSRPSSGRPSASRPSSGRPSASRPSSGRPSVSRPSASRPSVSRPSASRPSASRPSASRPSASRPSASRPSASRPSASRPSASRPSSDRPSASRPSALRVSASRRDLLNSASYYTPSRGSVNSHLTPYYSPRKNV